MSAVVQARWDFIIELITIPYAVRDDNGNKNGGSAKGRPSVFETANTGSSPVPPTMRGQLEVGCDALNVVTEVRFLPAQPAPEPAVVDRTPNPEARVQLPTGVPGPVAKFGLRRRSAKPLSSVRI